MHERMVEPQWRGLMVAHEVTLVAPGSPHNARELVGESDRRLVVTAPLLQIERPEA